MNPLCDPTSSFLFSCFPHFLIGSPPLWDPMSQHTMRWNCSRVSPRGNDELAAPQGFHGGLNGALGKTCFVRDHAQTHPHRLPALADRAAEQKQVNQIGGRLLIVRDKVAHQDVEHVVIDRDSPPEARHDRRITAIPIIGQHFSKIRAPLF